MSTDSPSPPQPETSPPRKQRSHTQSIDTATLAGEHASVGEDAESISQRHQITLRYDSQEWPGLTTPATSLEQSHLLPRYHIGGEIGRGGMGAIIKVVDSSLNRPVAMKVMLKAGDEFQRRRFVEEAQITGQLEHPGIVPVHEIGNDQRGNLYFTMKLVHGISLSEVLRRLADDDRAAAGEFPLTRLLRILVDVSHAVAFAHHRGVIHRDLKPANIMIGRFGEVQVMDWGLAKVLSDAPAPPRPARGPRPAAPAPASTTATGPSQAGTAVLSDAEQPITSTRDAAMNTQFGTIVGTPSYMSPEQASGDPTKLTNRSDIYSLGALLYEILTLTPPVRGSDTFAILARVVHGRIERPERRAPGRAIPSELSAVAMKALQGDPRLRYPSVEDFRADLDLYLDGRAVSAKADSPWETIGKLVRRNRTASTAIIAATVLIVLVVAGSFAMTVSDRQRAMRSERLALDTLTDLRREQTEKEAERAKRGEAEHRAIPGLILQAHAAVDNDHVEEASRTLDLALAIDGQNHEALLLRANIALVQRAWPAAIAGLQDYLAHVPGDRDAQQLLELAQSPAASAGSSARDAAIAAILARQGATHLATRIAGAFSQRVEILRRQVDQAWPGARDALVPIGEHGLAFYAQPLKAQVADLRPLHGVPLTYLDLKECQRVADLGPLRGMPLDWLSLDQCTLVTDLAPLAGMTLRHLILRNCNRIKDFSVLKGMPLEFLDLSECGHFTDLTQLAGMPLGELSLRSCALIADYSPLAGLPLITINVNHSPFSDCALLARIPTLRVILCGESQVKDITPFARMPLVVLLLPHDHQLAGLDLLRHHPTLTTIDFLPVAEFWKQYDQGNPGTPVR